MMSVCTCASSKHDWALMCSIGQGVGWSGEGPGVGRGQVWGGARCGEGPGCGVEWSGEGPGVGRGQGVGTIASPCRLLN